MKNRDRFDALWGRLVDKNVTAQDKPVAFVLGGQPGAGKSELIALAKEAMNDNVIIINGDDFRYYHPDFKQIYKNHGDDFVMHTAKFSSEMVERTIDKAIENKLNIVVEGTFRNPDTPLRTLKKLKDAGYRTEVMIKTTSATTSWNSTIERYNSDKEMGNIARKVDKNHHDVVVALLAENAKKVFDSGLADKFTVYSREKMLFNSETSAGHDVAKIIQNEIISVPQRQLSDHQPVISSPEGAETVQKNDLEHSSQLEQENWIDYGMD